MTRLKNHYHLPTYPSTGGCSAGFLTVGIAGEEIVFFGRVDGGNIGSQGLTVLLGLVVGQLEAVVVILVRMPVAVVPKGIPALLTADFMSCGCDADLSLVNVRLKTAMGLQSRLRGPRRGQTNCTCVAD